MSYQQHPVMHDGNTFSGSRNPYANYSQGAHLGRNQQVLKDSELASLCAQMSQNYMTTTPMPPMAPEGACYRSCLAKF